MKKVIVSIATACVLFISCGDIPPAMAAESSALCLSSAESPIETGVIEYEDLFCDMLDPAAVSDVGLRSTTRATNRIEWSLSAGEVAAMDTAYTLEADELVTINCTYSPRTADLDFGLITPDGTFRFTSGATEAFIPQSELTKPETTILLCAIIQAEQSKYWDMFIINIYLWNCVNLKGGE